MRTRSPQALLATLLLLSSPVSLLPQLAHAQPLDPPVDPEAVDNLPGLEDTIPHPPALDPELSFVSPQDTTAPLPTDATTTKPLIVDVAGPYRSFSGGVLLADRWNDPDPKKRWRIIFGGYLRIMYRAVQDDPNIQHYGRNDGFVYSNARPYFSGRMPNGLGFRFQFEAAATLPSDNDLTPYRQKVLRPRDAFLTYEPLPFLSFQLGQFKPPHNLEELLPTQDILFITRSVGNDGVSSFDGRRLPGLFNPREVGAQVTGQVFFTENPSTPRGPGIAYALAVTNGSDAERTFNDNDRLAYYARASLHWGELVSLGGAYSFNQTTLLNDLDSVDEDVTGLTADLKVDVAGLKLLAAFQQQTRETRFLATQQENIDGLTFTTGRALVAQIGYQIPVVGIVPAYRFSTFDPTFAYNQIDPQSQEIREIDALTYHTIGLSYLPATYPISIMVNYTIAGEHPDRTLENDRLEALVQITW